MNFLSDYFNIDNGSRICGLTSELNTIYIINLFKKTGRNVLVLTSSLYEANNYYNAIQTYTDDVLLFVMDDFISSMIKATSPELQLTRLNTLDKINIKPHIIVANIMGYLRYLPDVKQMKNSYITIKKGGTIDRDNFIKKLDELGYTRESLTTTTGEYSVRGMIVDVFPINDAHPVRIEFDDDVIDRIAIFDEDTQMSLNKIDEVIIKPLSEMFGSSHSSLVEYLDNPIIIKVDENQIKASYNHLVEEILEYTQRENISESLMYSFDEIKEDYVIYLNHFANGKNDISYQSQNIDSFNQDFDLLARFINKMVNDNKEVIFCLSDDKEIKKIRELFDKVKVIKQKINKGFIFDKYVVISEYDIENISRQYKYQNNFYGGKRIVSYDDLNIGDYVVHIAHGIGKYNGLATLTKNGVKKDYIQLLYMDNDKIYVPVEKIGNIYKYSDKDGSTPKLNRLNSSTWLKTRAMVRKKIEDISKELMALYKQRALVKRLPYKSFAEEELFDYEFNYTLTSDQQKAINDINDDLAKDYPMDRLLCGDVGFGKTEVAFRAMFKTVLNNRQVIYLCPTTILSRQQYKVAKERFNKWPVEIALLNRFTTPKEEKRIIDDLKRGTIDIVFGTHKLLNNKIEYKDAGLMIVDEEQRFGVKHKEQIKEMKNDINVLTLSATPIPRTLKMSLSGLRDLSIIDTAPNNRYPVQTYVVCEDELIIKDAIYKELSRKGQVFILYNNVQTIDKKVDSLRKLIPNEEIRYAHGQMDKTELENIMEDFVQQKFNILVCSTIIENGIDIPNVNTLIVYNADLLGLSQLYQLRGRVGRSDKVAYAYLMYDEHKMLNDSAIKRLEAIKEFTELGSGYRIAMRDLSIRGSGDIFGSSQAGFVDDVGISLYTKMVEDEINRQKGEFVEEEEDEQSLINVVTHIDDNYVSDEDIKIEIHKLINTIDSYDKLNNVKQILEDRFGKINNDIEIYMYEEWFEKIAKKLNITMVKQTDRLIEIELPEELTSKIKGDKLMYNAYSISNNFSLAYKHKRIIITLYYKSLEEHFIKYIIKLLSTLEQ